MEPWGINEDEFGSGEGEFEDVFEKVESGVIPSNRPGITLVAASSTNPTSTRHGVPSVSLSFTVFLMALRISDVGCAAFDSDIDSAPLEDGSYVVLTHVVDDQVDRALEAELSRTTSFHHPCHQLQRLFQPRLSIEEALVWLTNCRQQESETP
ncbi:unnamed protein product [Dibothriocephalus latus]|uniref:Uncharacterized protein n=1 Tax=Dibothriocephalus latus TaxID=60516 RepID=A0A3P6QG68_DIBLA|nr:unnamed protein product [Dibothriocephalus latus]